MKREYFLGIMLLVFIAIYFTAIYFIGYEKTKDITHDFFLVWVLIAYNVGQYSMKFPKAISK